MAKKKAQPLDDHPIETFYPSEVVDIDTLKPWPTNYNEHGEAQLTGLSQSLASFGQFKNVVAWRDYIVAGHGLIEGAVGRGWKRIEIKRLPSEWSESQVEAVLIADNSLPQLSTPNAEKLADMLQRVRLDNATLLDSVGYNNDEVDAMLRGLANMGQPGQGADAEPQIDRAAELQAKWQVKPGDLWRIGKHRLICGNCTDPAVVERVMGGEAPQIVIADPPYGVNIVATNVTVGGGEAYNIPFGGKKQQKGHVGGGELYRARHGHYPIQEPTRRAKRLGSPNGAKPFGASGETDINHIRGSDGAANVVDVGKYAPIIGDDTTDTAIRASSFYLGIFPDATHFWWGANYYADRLPPSSCWVVWDKETTGNFADCELAWCNLSKAARLFRHRWNGMLRDSERERRWHPTQKPAALAQWIYEQFGDKGNIVLDPFAGAGWSMIAAENSERVCRAIEMSEDYICVILQRMTAAFPGIEIERISP